MLVSAAKKAVLSFFLFILEIIDLLHVLQSYVQNNCLAYIKSPDILEIN